MDEEILQDKAHRGVIRRGGTVWRPMHPWSPAVHGLLRHLESVGFPAPRLLDVVGDREVLSYIDGESGADGWARVIPDDGLRRFARFLREYHAAVRDFRPTTPFYTGAVLEPGQIVCHGDFGPWNVVFRDGRPVGLIDFDYAQPCPPTMDIGYALEYVAPFRDDETCVKWLRYPSPPDRVRRMEIFAEAYGPGAPTTTADLIRTSLRVQHESAKVVTALAEAGLEPQATWASEGYLDELRERLDWSGRFGASVIGQPVTGDHISGTA